MLADLEVADEDALHYVMQRCTDDVAQPTDQVTTEQVCAYINAFGFVEDSYDKLRLVAS